VSGNTFGTLFRVTTFGESHGSAIGAVIDGCPAGVPLSESDIQTELNRRRPSGDSTGAGTSRKEPDTAEILSGVFECKTTGTPIAVLIRNTSQHSADYDNLKTSFRPGHADYAYTEKYGFRDHRGGGRASARETAGRVAGGAVAKALLKTVLGESYSVTAVTLQAAGIPYGTAEYTARIEQLRKQGDSCGGIVECRATGIPTGLGEPVFDKLDAELAKAMLSIGAVKGIEFGRGFESANLTGSEMNDSFYVDDDTNVRLASNNCGGILGGISTGSELVFRIAVKPVPSIFLEQQTVRQNADGTYENATLRIAGRHDVCICPRIVPVVKAMTHIVLADMFLRNKNSKITGIKAAKSFDR
jgi:chorismate synthase